MSTPDVSVIIVSYNTRDLTVACVRSIRERDTGCSIEIIVVDNDSRDGSVEAIKHTFSDTVVIANTDNKGFAAANNQALGQARGRYLLLLNPDTEIHDGAITKTLRFAEEHVDAGVVGVRCYHSDGTQQSTIFRDKHVLQFFINVFVPNRWMRRNALLGRSRYACVDLSEVRSVDVVAGCYMFLPREVYEKAGGLDENFFMYGEEAEWCHRIRSHGWSVYYYPDASILHYGGVSADRHPAEMNMAMAHSMLLLVWMTRGPISAWFANLAMLLRDTPRAMVWSVYRLFKGGENDLVTTTLRKAAGRFCFHLKGVLKPTWTP